MASERWIGEQVGRGEKAGAQTGRTFLSLGNVALPEQAVTQSTIDLAMQSFSPETQRLVEQLGDDGYAVCNLAGKPPATLRTEGMPLKKVNPGLEHVSVLPSLVAFRPEPSKFFLRGSHSIPYEQQLERLEEEKARVGRAYPGGGLVVRVGKAPEWPEIAWEYFKATGVRIFGKYYGYYWTWTDTYESEEPDARRAGVGSWHETLDGGGLNVLFDPRGHASPYSRLACLLEIPIENRFLDSWVLFPS